jgi:predicted O-methyltransferase YrrM
MDAGKLAAIARAALRPGGMGSLWRRAVNRLGTYGSIPEPENLHWLDTQAVAFASYATSLAPQLWEESLAYAEALLAHALRAFPERIGTGYYELLYFLTRYRRPKVVVETGVAAGFSSHAILSAMSANNVGHLYSSDLHYLRPDAERIVGVVVEEHLKDRWTLLTQGDARNLPIILRNVDRIDMVHYDSDKSYAGRRFAMRLLLPKLHGLLIMDDLRDNAFFYDFVRDRTGWRVFRRFATGESYVGLVAHQMQSLV